MGIVRNIVALGVGLAALVPSDEVLADSKSGYSLFRPTPEHLLRELSADRPDKTESARTVDAGWFQWETQLLGVAVDRGGGHSTRTWSFLPVHFRIGLLNSLELDLDYGGYSRFHSVRSGERGVEHGEFSVGFKWNVVGNDSDSFALAVMPYLSFPRHGHGVGGGAVNGGICFPWSIPLPGNWEMGMTHGVHFSPREKVRGDRATFTNSVSFSRPLFGNLSGYVEFFSEVSTDGNDPWIGTVDTGITYQINRNLQLDCGVNIGVTAGADEWEPFIGLTWRF